jgi:hypothetical protein
MGKGPSPQSTRNENNAKKIRKTALTPFESKWSKNARYASSGAPGEVVALGIRVNHGRRAMINRKEKKGVDGERREFERKEKGDRPGEENTEHLKMFYRRPGPTPNAIEYFTDFYPLTYLPGFASE